MKKFTFLMMVIFLSSISISAFGQEMTDVSPFQPVSTTIVPSTDGDATWDVKDSWSTLFAGEQAVAFAGDKYWTARWSVGSYIRMYNKTTHVKTDSFLAVTGIRDFAFDGTYLYAGTGATTVYRWPIVAPYTQTTITLSGAGVRHLCYDPTAYSNAGGFWAGNWTNLGLHPKTGGAATVTAPAPTSAYGSAWDNKTAGGPYVWLFCQTATGTPAGSGLLDLVQYRISSNTYTGVVRNCSGVTGVINAAATIAGGAECTEAFTPGFLTIVCNAQQSPNRVFVLELAPSTGINENQKDENLAVWPNPAVVNSYINMISTSNITNVKVYNPLGQVVYNETMNKHEVNISTANFAPGTYVINVIKDDGMVTKKVVVK